MSEWVEILKFYQEIGAEFIELEPRHPVMDLNEVNRQIMGCVKCELHKTKKNYVPGEGGLNPDIMFIGEGPGETEDNFGKPFIGKAGQLLDKLIARMGYTRESVFITNIVKCRPPGNREPLKAEVDACLPYLICQVEVVKPRVIVCLGRVAMNNLLGASYSISQQRGRQLEFMGIPVIPTYHPSYVLHQKTRDATSKAKWDMWHDMEKVLAIAGKARV
jgi:uracil-DNA glycosylase